MGRKERHGPVAPVVFEPRCSVLRIELVYRRQFYRCDAQFLKIGDLFEEPEVRITSLLFGDAGVWVTRKSGYMHFINHRRVKPDLCVAWAHGVCQTC